MSGGSAAVHNSTVHGLLAGSASNALGHAQGGAHPPPPPPTAGPATNIGGCVGGEAGHPKMDYWQEDIKAPPLGGRESGRMGSVGGGALGSAGGVAHIPPDAWGPSLSGGQGMRMDGRNSNRQQWRNEDLSGGREGPQSGWSNYGGKGGKNWGSSNRMGGKKDDSKGNTRSWKGEADTKSNWREREAKPPISADHSTRSDISGSSKEPSSKVGRVIGATATEVTLRLDVPGEIEPQIVVPAIDIEPDVRIPGTRIIFELVTDQMGNARAHHVGVIERGEMPSQTAPQHIPPSTSSTPQAPPYPVTSASQAGMNATYPSSMDYTAYMNSGGSMPMHMNAGPPMGHIQSNPMDYSVQMYNLNPQLHTPVYNPPGGGPGLGTGTVVHGIEDLPLGRNSSRVSSATDRGGNLGATSQSHSVSNASGTGNPGTTGKEDRRLSQGRVRRYTADKRWGIIMIDMINEDVGPTCHLRPGTDVYFITSPSRDDTAKGDLAWRNENEGDIDLDVKVGDVVAFDVRRRKPGSAIYEARNVQKLEGLEKKSTKSESLGVNKISLGYSPKIIDLSQPDSNRAGSDGETSETKPLSATRLSRTRQLVLKMHPSMSGAQTTGGGPSGLHMPIHTLINPTTHVVASGGRFPVRPPAGAQRSMYTDQYGVPRGEVPIGAAAGRIDTGDSLQFSSEQQKLSASSTSYSPTESQQPTRINEENYYVNNPNFDKSLSGSAQHTPSRSDLAQASNFDERISQQTLSNYQQQQQTQLQAGRGGPLSQQQAQMSPMPEQGGQSALTQAQLHQSPIQILLQKPLFVERFDLNVIASSLVQNKLINSGGLAYNTHSPTSEATLLGKSMGLLLLKQKEQLDRDDQNQQTHMMSEWNQNQSTPVAHGNMGTMQNIDLDLMMSPQQMPGKDQQPGFGFDQQMQGQMQNQMQNQLTTNQMPSNQQHPMAKGDMMSVQPNDNQIQMQVMHQMGGSPEWSPSFGASWSDQQQAQQQTPEQIQQQILSYQMQHAQQQAAQQQVNLQQAQQQAAQQQAAQQQAAHQHAQQMQGQTMMVTPMGAQQMSQNDPMCFQYQPVFDPNQQVDHTPQGQHQPMQGAQSADQSQFYMRGPQSMVYYNQQNVTNDWT